MEPSILDYAILSILQIVYFTRVMMVSTNRLLVEFVQLVAKNRYYIARTES